MMNRLSALDILLRRIPWPGLILIVLGWGVWFKAPELDHDDVTFFAMGMGVCFFLTGIICVYLHAIWYRLYRAGRTDRP